jgi:hypothetical protein
VIRFIVIIIVRYHCHQLHTKFYPLKVRSVHIGDHQCGFRCNRSTTDQIYCIRRILKKKWEYNETVHQLYIDFKKAYDSVRMEVLYNILIEFGVPMKLVKVIKMCVN